MGFNGAIFDFNGTLFWDTEYNNQAWDLFMAEYGIVLSDAERNQKLQGKTNQETLQILFQKDFSAEEFQTLTRQKESIYQNICLQHPMTLAPGAASLLDYLKESRIAYAIATSAVVMNIQFYFEHLNLAKWFAWDQIVYNDGLIKSKPDPEIFRKTMKKMQRVPGEVVVFEDSFSGIMAAERAGAGQVIVVDSIGENYSRWNFPVIRSFDEVDRNMFR